MSGEGPLSTAVPGSGTAAGAQLFGGAGGAAPQGPSPSDVLGQLMAPQIDPKTLQAAVTPIPTGHTMQPSTQLMNPIPQFQADPLQHQQVVGKHNAKMQGIGNAISGVANAVTSVINAEQRKTQMKTSTSVTQLINAQTAIDQAQTALKADPNNKDAKDALQHNQNVRDTILEDKKVRTAISKGMQISFTDPSQNKTDDHQAVQKGIADAKKQSSYGEQFEKQMPVQTGQNPYALQRLQLQQSQQAQSMQMLRAFMPLITSSQRFSQAQALQKMKEIYTTQKDYRDQIAKIYLEKYKAMLQGGNIDRRAAHEMLLEGKRHADAVDLLNQRIQAAGGDPIKITKLIQDENRNYQTEDNARQARIDNLQGQITSLVAAKVTDANGQQRIKDLNKQIADLQVERKGLEKTHSAMMSSISSIPGLSESKETGGAGGTGSGSIQSGSGDTTDPEDELNKLYDGSGDEGEGSFDPTSTDPSDYSSPN
jgi:hypothetical protein